MKMFSKIQTWLLKYIDWLRSLYIGKSIIEPLEIFRESSMEEFEEELKVESSESVELSPYVRDIPAWRIIEFVENAFYVDDCDDYPNLELWIEQKNVIEQYCQSQWSIVSCKSFVNSQIKRTLYYISLYFIHSKNNFKILHLSETEKLKQESFKDFGYVHDYTLKGDYHCIESIEKTTIFCSNENSIRFSTIAEYLTGDNSNYGIIFIETSDLMTEPIHKVINSLSKSTRVMITVDFGFSYPIFLENLKQFETLTIL